jgi:pimeloyl-ACP methyl ester carboxylesterase
VGVTGDEPAYVFGNSSGAIIGLELGARHPGQVRTLVAHEPPLFELLPDRDRFRVVVRNVEEAFVEKGAEAAGQILTARLPMSGGRQENGGKERIPGGEEAPRVEPDKELMEMMARLEKNMEFFLGYEVRPFATYSPDLAALRGVRDADRGGGGRGLRRRAAVPGRARPRRTVGNRARGVRRRPRGLRHEY